MGIEYREDRNAWRVVYFLDGCRHRKDFKTRLEAEGFEAAIKGSPTGQSSLKLAIRKYVEIHTAKKQKRNDEKLYFTLLFDFMQDIGATQVNQIKLEHLQQFQSQLLNDRGLKATSVNRYFNTYRHFFSACKDWGYIKDLPTDSLKDFPEPSGVVGRKILTDEQIEYALSVTSGWLKEFIYLVAYTGMRPIEVCRLTWDGHIDLKAGRVLAECYKGSGQKLTRWVPLRQDIVEMLSARRAKSRHKFVFVSEQGNPLNTQTVSRKFRLKVQQPGWGLYGMRHSFATHALQSGVDLEALRLMLGHRSLSTTQVYLQYTDDHLKAAMAKANGARKISRLLPPTAPRIKGKKTSRLMATK